MHYITNENVYSTYFTQIGKLACLLLRLNDRERAAGLCEMLLVIILCFFAKRSKINYYEYFVPRDSVKNTSLISKYFECDKATYF